MLAPAVLNFKAPPSRFESHIWEGENGYKKCLDFITSHHYNYLVSVILPNISSIPFQLKNSLIEDCTYYLVEKIDVLELINKTFIDGFVKTGELTALSHETLIDSDDCVGITPSGYLVLSLPKAAYQTLGIEGKPASFCQKAKDRYVIYINLKQGSFIPKRKFYERVKLCLTSLYNMKVNMIFAWESPEENICPSSLAAYFYSKGYKVSACEPRSNDRTGSNTKIPILSEYVRTDLGTFLEWLGLYSIGGELEPSNEYLSSYKTPTYSEESNGVTLLQWTGYFTVKKIQELFDLLWKFSADSKLPWSSMYVQGFADSPVSWKLQEKSFYTNGDNNYVICWMPEDKFVACSYTSQ